MPIISSQCGDIDIYMLVTNNVLSCSLQYNFKFNLNGFKRKALSDEHAKKSPTYKDNEFKQLLPKVCVCCTGPKIMG